MHNLILFCPPKIIFQHALSDWISVIGQGGVLLSCKSQQEKISEFFGDSINFILFDDFNNNAKVELEAIEISKKIENPICVAMAEIDVLRVSRVNDYLGITTDTEQDQLFYRDKYLMKERARSCGLPVADMAPVKSAMDILKFIGEHDYPVVLKPRDGRGSNGVNVIRDYSQLVKWLSQQSSSTFYNTMIESYVEGQHYIVNALYVNGSPILISPVKVMTSALDFLWGKSHDLHMLNQSNPMRDRLVDYTADLIERVLPSQPTSLFHLEVFVTKNNEIVLCEIASRLGGCFFNEEMTEAWGLNPRMTYLSAMKNSDLNIAQRKEPDQLVGHINIPPKHGLLTSAPDSCPFDFVLKYKMSGVVGKEYHNMAFTNAEILNAIVGGDSEEDIISNLNQLEEWFKRSTSWQDIS